MAPKVQDKHGILRLVTPLPPVQIDPVALADALNAVLAKAPAPPEHVDLYTMVAATAAVEGWNQAVAS